MARPGPTPERYGKGGVRRGLAGLRRAGPVLPSMVVGAEPVWAMVSRPAEVRSLPGRLEVPRRASGRPQDLCPHPRLVFLITGRMGE